MTRRNRPPGLIIIVLALSGMAVALNQTLVVPLLPDLPVLLHTSPDNSSWLVTITLLVSAVTTPILSRLADVHGKRRLMLICLVSTLVGSLVGATSDSLSGLLVARALQGLAPALIPIGISAMRDEIPEDRIGGAVALMSATFGIGGAVGLPVSGLIYDALGWQAVFWGSLVGAAVVLALVLVVVPDSGLRAPARFDWGGAVLLSLALAGLLLAISKGGAWGWLSRWTGACVAAAAVCFIAWVRHELTTPEPLVDLRTSVRRTVLITNVVSLIAGFAMFGNLLVAIQQLQIPIVSGAGLGLSGTQAGLAMLPAGLLSVAMAPVTAVMMRRTSDRSTLIVGFAVMAIGYTVRALFDGTVAELVIGVCIAAAGITLCAASMPVLIMRSVRTDQSAAANGVNQVVRLVGMALCSAMVAAVLAAGTEPGHVWPSAISLRRTSEVAAAASVAGALLSLLIPRAVRRPDAPFPRSREEGRRSTSPQPSPVGPRPRP